MSNAAKIICFANQKGGCGKTTMANEMAAGLVKEGYRVLAIDMDPQGNLSNSAGAVMSSIQTTEHPTMYEVLKETVPAVDAIQHCKNYDIIPANLFLANAEMELVSKTGREMILRKAMKSIRPLYDYVIIDTPPSLGILTINAFTASDAIIIPLLPDLYAIEGMVKLTESVNVVQEYFNPTLTVSGIVLTQFENQTNSSQTLTEIANNAAERLEVKPYKTRIRKAAAVRDARTNQMTIEDYGKMKGRKAKVQTDFEEFIQEFLAREENETWL